MSHACIGIQDPVALSCMPKLSPAKSVNGVDEIDLEESSFRLRPGYLTLLGPIDRQPAQYIRVGTIDDHN